MGVKIEGQAFKKLLELDKIDLTEALLKASVAVENTARQLCPVDTGELRQSIQHQLVDKNTAEVYTNLPYAPYIEYGTGLFAAEGGGRTDVPWVYQDEKGDWHTTSGQPPQPFMKPALQQNRSTVKEIIQDSIASQIREVME